MTNNILMPKIFMHNFWEAFLYSLPLLTYVECEPIRLVGLQPELIMVSQVI